MNPRRIALVTGGTRGIGLGIASALQEDGWTVITCARRAVDGHPFPFHAVDLRLPEAAAALVDRVVADHGGLDLLVNNAGGAPPAEAATASPRFHDKVVALNLLAPLHLSQAAWRVMHQGSGHIINIASTAGVRPAPGTSVYGAAKAGLLHLTRALAIEWAPKVRVNAVAPGLIHTEAADQVFEDQLTAMVRSIPLGRPGTSADVGAAVAWLASPAAAWMSGSTLVLDGGGEIPAWYTPRERP